MPTCRSTDHALLSTEPLVPLLSDGQLDTLALGQRDVWLVTLADDEDIAQPGGKDMTIAILHVDNVERSLMPLPGHDGSNPASIATSCDHAEVASVEPDGVLDLASGDVHLDTVMYPHGRGRVADGPAITGVQVGDVLGASLDLTDTAQLVLSLSSSDAVDNESALHVIDDAEVLPGLLNLDDIHKASGEPGVSPQLAVNLDQTLLADGFHLLHGQGVLETVPEEKCNGKGLRLLVKPPPSLSSIHDWGAAKRFKCFLGPLGMLNSHFSCRSEIKQVLAW